MAKSFSQDLGQQLEDAVTAANERYAALGLLQMGKVATPIKQLSKMKSDGSFLARHEQRAHVDFYGVVRAGVLRGQACALECKATADGRFPYSGIRPQQREWLDATPLAFVLVHFTRLNSVRLIPWNQFAAKTSVGPEHGLKADAVDWAKHVIALTHADLEAFKP